ncbi:MAG: hypothetical protein IPJ34_26115 [Myxococcales bacterium]|nr:hypothetical protein [Myxococcales bacterium]
MREEHAKPAPGALESGVLTYREVHPGVDWVVTASPGVLEDQHVVRSPLAVRPIVYEITLGPAVASVVLARGALHAADAHGSVRLRTRPIVARDAQGTDVPVTLSLTVAARVARLSVAPRPALGARYPLTVDPLWEATTSLGTPRDLAAATVLPDGKVLVAGGATGSASVLATAERFDPATTAWTPVGALSTARWRHRVVTSGGKTLVLGGSSSSAFSDPPALSSTELFDAATGTFSAGPPLGAARATFTTTILPGGKVLVVGGENGAVSLSSVELWDPAAGTIVSKKPMSIARAEHGAVLLPSGKVLVAGGRSGSTPLSTTEIYDPASDTWTASGSMATARAGLGLVVLDDKAGTVLAMGGLVDLVAQTSIDSAERWVGGVWVATPQVMSRNRGRFVLGTMPYGRVVVAGGQDGGFSRMATNLFSLSTEEWIEVGSLSQFRFDAASVQLGPSRILAIGGTFQPYLPSAGLTKRIAEADVDLFNGLANGSPCIPGTDGVHLQCEGACVDLFCCDRICDGNCESCTLGLCKTVPDGPPSSPRTCPGAYSRCKGGACATSCATDDECNQDFYCDGALCQPRKALGVLCQPSKAGRDCASNICADGVCCEQKCDSPCEACNVKGRRAAARPWARGRRRATRTPARRTHAGSLAAAPPAPRTATARPRSVAAVACARRAAPASARRTASGASTRAASRRAAGATAAAATGAASRAAWAPATARPSSCATSQPARASRRAPPRATVAAPRAAPRMRREECSRSRSRWPRSDGCGAVTEGTDDPMVAVRAGPPARRGGVRERSPMARSPARAPRCSPSVRA